MLTKEERENGEQIQKVVLGYDPNVWMEIEVRIRDTDHQTQSYSKITLPPRFKASLSIAIASQFYIYIHRLIADREWDPTPSG